MPQALLTRVAESIVIYVSIDHSDASIIPSCTALTALVSSRNGPSDAVISKFADAVFILSPASTGISRCARCQPAELTRHLGCKQHNDMPAVTMSPYCKRDIFAFFDCGDRRPNADHSAQSQSLRSALPPSLRSQAVPPCPV